MSFWTHHADTGGALSALPQPAPCTQRTYDVLSACFCVLIPSSREEEKISCLGAQRVVSLPFPRACLCTRDLYRGAVLCCRCDRIQPTFFVFAAVCVLSVLVSPCVCVRQSCPNP